MRKPAIAALAMVAALASGCALPSSDTASGGSFSPTGSLRDARDGHTAVLLADGRVLITGGASGCCEVWTSIGSAELYDPATGTFDSAGLATPPLDYQVATLLLDGRVLVADSGAAELYDPATRRFTQTGSPIGSPHFTTITRLTDGRVLLAGTYDPSGPAVAELFDPKTGNFSITGSMLAGCIGSSATPLADGRVLLLGCGGTDPAGAQLYDPASGTFSLTGAMMQSRIEPTATLLADGRVLVTGGTVDNADGATQTRSSAEIFDPASGVFRTTGPMTQARAGHTATLLANGEVIVAGGSGPDSACSDTAELFDPATGTFRPVESTMVTGRSYGGTATLLRDGRVLMAGGSGCDAHDWGFQVQAAEIYTPRVGASLPWARDDLQS